MKFTQCLMLCENFALVPLCVRNRNRELKLQILSSHGSRHCAKIFRIGSLVVRKFSRELHFSKFAQLCFAQRRVHCAKFRTVNSSVRKWLCFPCFTWISSFFKIYAILSILNTIWWLEINKKHTKNRIKTKKSN